MISYVFAGIGAGKTTYAIRVLKKELDKIHSGKSAYKHLFCNFHNKLVPRVDMSEFGPKVFPDYSLVVVDESGIDYNNRFYKKMLIETIEEFKISRHRHCDMIIISQGWDDCDITIRRLCQVYWHLRWMGPFTFGRKIYKDTRIDPETHQPIDYYELGKILPCILPPPFHRTNIMLFLRKPYYIWFNSYDAPKKPLMSVLDMPKYYTYAKAKAPKKSLKKYIKLCIKS